MKIFSFLLFTLFCFQCTAGTLIVTYQTGINCERLDRIRFLITDEKQHVQIYPKGKSYVDDVECRMRMVLIENLTPGNYLLEFLVPNSDGIFENVPMRYFKMEPEATIKIDQVIKIHYSSIKAEVKFAEEISKPKEQPTIALKQGNSTIQQSENGTLHAMHLLPGEYSIVFSALPGFIAPQPLKIKLKPGENVGPFFGTYKLL